METRLILEHDFGDVRLDLNPSLSKITSGPNLDESMQLGLATGVYYRRFYRLQPGLELFSEFGPVSDLASTRDQHQILFATLNYRFNSGLVWQVGVGKGLTDASDDLTIKSIIAYEFETVRPAHWAK